MGVYVCVYVCMCNGTPPSVSRFSFLMWPTTSLSVCRCRRPCVTCAVHLHLHRMAVLYCMFVIRFWTHVRSPRTRESKSMVTTNVNILSYKPPIRTPIRPACAYVLLLCTDPS